MTARTHPAGLEVAGMMPVSDAEFREIQGLVHARIGIALGEDKRTLVAGRMQMYLREEGLPSFAAFLARLRADPTGQDLVAMVDRISTNFTFFYRESDHFDFLSVKVLPEILARHSAVGSRDLRIWCAAAATGEEPYTLMMLVMERLGASYGAWNAGLLATDISRRALEEARIGVYPADRASRLPPALKTRYMDTLPDGRLRVREQVRREVVFRHFNLVNEVFPFKKPFDIIFCRNVLIYFDAPTRDALVRRLHTSLAPGGWLFIGHSETLRTGDCPLAYVRPSVYRKEG